MKCSIPFHMLKHWVPYVKKMLIPLVQVSEQLWQCSAEAGYGQSGYLIYLKANFIPQHECLLQQKDLCYFVMYIIDLALIILLHRFTVCLVIIIYWEFATILFPKVMQVRKPICAALVWLLVHVVNSKLSPTKFNSTQRSQSCCVSCLAMPLRSGLD